MVQKEKARTRGRPRQYDPRQALAKAMDTFWRNGYAGTSMDDLSAATKMNRPSLYGAFGDKRQIYLSALDSYISDTDAMIRAELTPERPLRQALARLYKRMLSIMYLREARRAAVF